MAKQAEQGDYYAPEDIQRKLSVSRRTVYGWLRSGALESYKAGRQWRISEAQLQRFLTKRQE